MSSTGASFLEGVVLVEYKSMRFVFSPAPPPVHVKIWVQRLHELGVSLLVRVSEDQPYTNKDLGDIKLVTFPLQDGSVPDKDQSKIWDDLVTDFFKHQPSKALAIHCTAGLGRSAVLVGMSLIERGLSAGEAIELVRSKRRGALNAKQATYLLDYKGRKRRFCDLL